MWPNLVTFTEEIFNGKLYFLCSVQGFFQHNTQKRSILVIPYLLETGSKLILHKTSEGVHDFIWTFYILSMRDPSPGDKKYTSSIFQESLKSLILGHFR